MMMWGDTRFVAWKVCSALRDDEPIWSWQLSQQPCQEVAKFDELSDTQCRNPHLLMLASSSYSLFLLSFLSQKTFLRPWPAYRMSQSFRAFKTSRPPGLAQIRTAQIPGRGTAGGGPTSAKAASQGLQRFTLLALSRLVSVWTFCIFKNDFWYMHLCMLYNVWRSVWSVFSLQIFHCWKL